MTNEEDPRGVLTRAELLGYIERHYERRAGFRSWYDYADSHNFVELLMELLNKYESDMQPQEFIGDGYTGRRCIECRREALADQSLFHTAGCLFSLCEGLTKLQIQIKSEAFARAKKREKNERKPQVNIARKELNLRDY